MPDGESGVVDVCYLPPPALECVLRVYIQNLFRGREPEISIAGHSATIDLTASEEKKQAATKIVFLLKGLSFMLLFLNFSVKLPLSDGSQMSPAPTCCGTRARKLCSLKIESQAQVVPPPYLP